MFWIFFAVWMAVGIIYHICSAIEKTEESSKSKRKKTVFGMGMAGTIGFVVVMIFGIILFLWLLGWIWYFFCSGFLLFEDLPFWDKVIYGLITLLPLGCILGLIGIAFGWDPWKK